MIIGHESWETKSSEACLHISSGLFAGQRGVLEKVSQIYYIGTAGLDRRIAIWTRMDLIQLLYHTYNSVPIGIRLAFLPVLFLHRVLLISIHSPILIAAQCTIYRSVLCCIRRNAAVVIPSIMSHLPKSRIFKPLLLAVLYSVQHLVLRCDMRVRATW